VGLLEAGFILAVLGHIILLGVGAEVSERQASDACWHESVDNGDSRHWRGLGVFKLYNLSLFPHHLVRVFGVFLLFAARR
jgi:hypothetical protein